MNLPTDSVLDRATQDVKQIVLGNMKGVGVDVKDFNSMDRLRAGEVRKILLYPNGSR